MSKEDVEKWRTQAANVGPHATNPLDVPFDIAIKEATQTAGFIEKYWEPKDGKPGLKRTQKRLPLSVKADLLSLIAAIQTTQTEYLLIVDPRVIQLGERANFLINKLENVLGFVLDDGIDEPEDAMLAQLKDFHSQDSQRSAALSQSLQNYATLAEKLTNRIKQEDEDFDLSYQRSLSPRWPTERESSPRCSTQR